jgi:hypothetical protein
MRKCLVIKNIRHLGPMGMFKMIIADSGAERGSIKPLSMIFPLHHTLPK